MSFYYTELVSSDVVCSIIIQFSEVLDEAPERTFTRSISLASMPISDSVPCFAHPLSHYLASWHPLELPRRPLQRKSRLRLSQSEWRALENLPLFSASTRICTRKTRLARHISSTSILRSLFFRTNQTSTFGTQSTIQRL